MPSQLHRQITGESIRAFDQDVADTIAGDVLQHLLEAGALADRIGAADRGVVILGDEFVTMGLESPYRNTRRSQNRFEAHN